MKKLNKRGFTMVELLATIVIIGILGTVGVVGVTRSIKSAKDRYYVAQNKLFISAAQTYFTDNKSRLPMYEPLSKRVTLETLNKENYIEEMVDYSKKPYNKKSYVKVTKLGLNLYSYEGTLIDSNGDVKDYKNPGKYPTNVEFTVDNDKFPKGSETKYTNRGKTVNIKIKDDDGIAGYKITIQKRGKSINELDYIRVGDKTTAENKIVISTDKYGDGEYSVKVRVYDMYNNQKSFISGKIVVDTIAPTCKYVGDDSSWTNKLRYIIYTGEDELSGLDKNTTKINSYGIGETVVKTVKGERYSIKDKAGNTRVCDYTTTDINIYYDGVPPKCTYSGDSTTWTYYDRTITIGCDDGVDGSDCKVRELPTIFNKSIKEAVVSGKIEDNAGNSKECRQNVNVYVDKKIPTVEIKNDYDGDWKNKEFVDGKNYRFFVKTNVGDSGLVQLKRQEDNGNWEDVITNETKYETAAWTGERDSNVCYKAINGAGKESDPDCTNVKIDKTAPKPIFHHDTDSTQIYAKCEADPQIGKKNGSGQLSFYAEYAHASEDPHPENDCGQNETWGTCRQYTDSSTQPDKKTKFKCKDKAGNVSSGYKPLTCTGTEKEGNFKCN